MQQDNYTLNYKLWSLDNEYKLRTNLNKHIEQAQNFYNGKQYNEKNYRNMIRGQINICSFSSTIKASKIVGTPIFIKYTSEAAEELCLGLERFDKYNVSKLNEDTENFQSALNGLNNGTEITFYRWDDDDTTYKGIYKGGLQIEHIDPRNFAVANPHISDIQNQKYVEFWKYEEVGALREMVEGKNDKEIEKKRALLLPDDYVDTNRADMHLENINHKLAMLYTRFFRVDGEVFFTCSTKYVDLFEHPHAINPRLSESIGKKLQEAYEKKEENDTERIVDYDIDFEDLVMQIHKEEAIKDSDYKKIKEKFSLYPFAVFTPFVITGSFYGRSDVEQLIAIQKIINFNISMVSMCAQNNAYNKIFAKEGALQGQEITNEPGQLITDYSKFTNGWGIKMAESQPMPNGLIEFTNNLLGMTRVVYGFSDVMDGSISNKDISGYAVQQMIKQANTSIEQQQKLFWKFCKDKAEIRLMFYKHFVEKAKYVFELEDYKLEREEQARMLLEEKRIRNGLNVGNIPLEKTRKVQVQEISKEDIYGISFDIAIDVLQGTTDSKLVEGQMWDTLVMNGGIQNMQPEMLELYINANPMVSERTKTALKQIVAKQKHTALVQAREQIQQLTSQLEQIQKYSEQLQAQSSFLSQYNKNLTNEFTDKINTANKVNQMLSKAQVSEGEAKSLNARGMGGADIVDVGTAE